MNKKVSILMPAHNASSWIKEAVDSIMNQTYNNWELIIVDDASTDKTYSVLKILKDKRIKVIKNNTNLGVAKSLNKALKVARGYYVARMDSDDISMSKRLEKQVKYLDNNPDVDLCGTAAYLINEEGKIIGRRSYMQTDRYIKRALPIFNPVIHPSFMAKKSFFEKYKGYNDKFDGAEDYELLLRSMNNSKFANLNDRLIKLRLRRDNRSRSAMNRMDLLDLRLKLNYIKENPYNILAAISIIRKILLIYVVPLSLKIALAKHLKRV